MRVIVIICVILLLDPLKSLANLDKKDFLSVTCYLKNKNSEETRKSFSKTFNLKTHKLDKQKNLIFDKVLTFNENEVILVNNVYDSYSVLDIHSLTWTTYFSNKIHVYQCK